MEIFATPKYNYTMETVGNPSDSNKKSFQTPSVMDKKSKEAEDVVNADTSNSEKKPNKKGNDNVEDVDLDVQVEKKKRRKKALKVSGAPTKSPPAFLKWSIQERTKINKQMGNLSFAEMGKELANRWAEINPEGKQPVDFLLQPVAVYEEAVQYLLKKADYDKASSSYTGTLPSGSGSMKGRRNQDPGAPKKPLSMFLKWSMEERSVIKEELGLLKTGDMGKELGRRWEVLQPDLKQLYADRYKQEKAEYDVARGIYLVEKEGFTIKDYDKASSSYTGTLPSGSVKMKGRKKRDPGEPKKPAPMFLKWSMQERSVIKEELGPLKLTDMGKELGRRWAVLHPDVKQLYADRYKQEKEEYNVARGRYLVEKKADYIKASSSYIGTLPTGKVELGNYTSHPDTTELTAFEILSQINIAKNLEVVVKEEFK